MGVDNTTDGKTCRLHSDLYTPLDWFAQTTAMLHFGDPYATRSTVPEDIRGKILMCFTSMLTDGWLSPVKIRVKCSEVQS